MNWFFKYLLSIDRMAGIVLGDGDLMGNKIGNDFIFLEFIFLWR